MRKVFSVSELFPEIQLPHLSVGQDIENIEKSGADAVLIGETLMRADDTGAKMRELKGGKD